MWGLAARLQLAAFLLAFLPDALAFYPVHSLPVGARVPSALSFTPPSSLGPWTPQLAPQRRARLARCNVGPLALVTPAATAKLSLAATGWGLVLSEFVVLALSGAFVMFCEKRYSKHARWQLPVPLPSAIELWITAAFVAGFVLPLAMVIAGVACGVSSSLLTPVFLPYFLGVIGQLVSWRTLGFRGSPAWPLVPVPFIVWRMVQLARGAALFSAAGAPWIFSALLQGVLLPFWLVALFGHLLLWPVLYKWPLEDLSLSTPVGPVPTTPLDLRQIDTGGARLLEELKQATQQRDRLQMRANNLKRMNTFREVGGDRAREKTKEE